MNTLKTESSISILIPMTLTAPPPNWILLQCYTSKSKQRHLGGSVVECLPLAQVMILGSSDGVLHQGPGREPASPSAYVSASLCVSLTNK